MKPRLERYWDNRTTGFKANNLSTDYAHDIIRNLVPLFGELNLEIGTGYGRMIPIYNGANADYIGIELDSRAATFSKKHFFCQIIIADMRNLPFRNGIFDSVLSVGVVEHVPETELALLEHLRVVKPNGKCLTLIPSLYSPFIGPPMLRAMKRLYNGRDWQIHFGTRFTSKRLKILFNEIHAVVYTLRHTGISLPGQAEHIFRSIAPWIGNAYLIIFGRSE